MRIWKPNVTVAAVVERDGRFLVVEEETDDGLRFNQPAGHLDEGESLVQAAAREALEETAHQFRPEFLVGIYQWPRPAGDITYLRFAFGGARRPVSTRIARSTDGIVRAVWMSLDELRATRERHRSPLILQCCEDYIAGRRFPLDLIRHYDA
jgi:8-oxo-dGTP pyrophosphatase MutT (NUDIX family)